MENNFTLLKRLLAKTPPFWNRVGILGLLLCAIATGLLENGIWPVAATYIAAIGGTLALISRFAKTDIEIIYKSKNLAEAIKNISAELPGQINDVRESIDPLINRKNMHLVKNITQPKSTQHK